LCQELLLSDHFFTATWFEMFGFCFPDEKLTEANFYCKLQRKNVKIGQYLAKIWTRVWWLVFFHSTTTMVDFNKAQLHGL